MVKFEHTTYSLGFKVSKELLEDDQYSKWNKIPFLHKIHKRLMKAIFQPGPLFRLRKHHTPTEDWPPKPDDLNVRWWEK